MSRIEELAKQTQEDIEDVHHVAERAKEHLQFYIDKKQDDKTKELLAKGETANNELSREIPLDKDLVAQVSKFSKEAEQLNKDTENYVNTARQYLSQLQKSKQLERTSDWQKQE